MSSDGVRLHRPLPGLLVADGLFVEDELELLNAVEAVPLQVQQVGLAKAD